MIAHQRLSFGEMLRQSRLAAGLTQEALAERANLSARAVSDLERGLKLRPRFDTVNLLASALRLDTDASAALIAASRREEVIAPPPLAEPVLVHNVPAPLTTIVGRERDEATLLHLLKRPEVRLLTLLGPAGVGKTRLALHIANNTDDSVADIVIFVPLDGLSEPSLTLSTIGHAVGATDLSDQPLLTQISSLLTARRTLLVLDNFEQILEAAPLVIDLLAASPTLRVLVTSRAALRIRGEHEYTLAPLALPAALGSRPSGELDWSPAMRLFVQRAQAIKPDFELTEANAPVIARICARLDGLPLAIELAAARVKFLALPVLLAKLEQSLNILGGGATDLPARQRTLLGALAWSYDLLSGQEQALFRRLCVFVGGFTADGALAVYLALEGEMAPEMADAELSVFETLTALVNKSLIASQYSPHEESGEPRFTMLQTVREAGLQRLGDAGELERARMAHLDFYDARFAELHSRTQGLLVRMLLLGIAHEHDNVRAALTFARDRQDVERGLRMAGNLWGYWFFQRRATEGRSWIATFKELADRIGVQPSPLTMARALATEGSMAQHQRDMARSIELSRQSLEIYKTIDPHDIDEPTQLDVSGVLRFLGHTYRDMGDLTSAADLYQQSLDVARQLDHAPAIALSLASLSGMARIEGDLARALELGRAAATAVAGFDDPYSQAIALTMLGSLENLSGDIAAAEAHLEDALKLARRTEEVLCLTHALNALATFRVEQGDDARAAHLFVERLRLYDDIDPIWSAAPTLLGLARIFARHGDLGRAVRLVASTATQIKDSANTSVSDAERVSFRLRFDGWRTTMIEQSGSDELFQKSWAEGQAMTIEEAIDEALRGYAAAYPSSAEQFTLSANAES